MSKWIHTTLNDICRSDKGAIISGPFGSNISSKFFVLDGVPVIRGNNLSLSLDKFYDDDFVFVTEEKADELNCYAEEGDLIFTAAGTIGQVGILEAPLKYKKYVISNKQLRARIDTRKVDLLYAYYWFASAWMQNYFIRNNKGSTVPLITLSELKDAPISYPEDITEQKKIAMAIEAISRKINNNRNICFNLESMAKTLYDYWFTQFDFPNAEGKPYHSSGGEMVWNDQLKREIPKGWTPGTISSLMKIENTSVNPQKLGNALMEHYSIPAFDANHNPAYEEAGTIESGKYVVDPECILTSKLNPHFKRLWDPYCDTENAICSTEFIVYRPRTAWTRPFCYAVLNSEAFYAHMVGKATASTGSRKRIQPDVSASFELAIPDEKTMRAFVELYAPIMEKQKALYKENCELTKLRDWLLPVLMNGQATVE